MRNLAIVLFAGLSPLPVQAMAATQPTVGIVQSAYEREVDRGAPRSIKICRLLRSIAPAAKSNTNISAG